MRDAGYEVTHAADGAEGLRLGESRPFDAIILDVLLPELDGWRVLERLRTARVNVPVLMLTALDETSQKVRGLELGADDYLAKPFDTPELLARIKALLRRDKANKGGTIQIADLVIDRHRRAVLRSGIEIPLTRREYDLLEALAVNERRVLSRETIQRRIWSDEEGYSNTVDVYIGMLRKKIDSPFTTKLIHTVVGFGYVLRAEE